MTTAAEEIVADQLASAKAPCITSSFQAEDMVVVDLARRVRPDIPVLFLETFHHFEATLTYRDEMAARWGLNLINLKAPEPEVGLWRTSTDACCAKHKVGPLFAALAAYDVWFTGLRRQQSASRANLNPVEAFHLPTGETLTKVSPLAHWTTKDVWAYAKAHDIPLLPLYELGYVSIGCEPCTRPVNPSQHEREGRWWWEEETRKECGLHAGNVEKA